MKSIDNNVDVDVDETQVGGRTQREFLARVHCAMNTMATLDNNEIAQCARFKTGMQAFTFGERIQYNLEPLVLFGLLMWRTGELVDRHDATREMVYTMCDAIASTVIGGIPVSALSGTLQDLECDTEPIPIGSSWLDGMTFLLRGINETTTAAAATSTSLASLHTDVGTYASMVLKLLVSLTMDAIDRRMSFAPFSMAEMISCSGATAATGRTVNPLSIPWVNLFPMCFATFLDQVLSSKFERPETAVYASRHVSLIVAALLHWTRDNTPQGVKHVVCSGAFSTLSTFALDTDGRDTRTRLWACFPNLMRTLARIPFDVLGVHCLVDLPDLCAIYYCYIYTVDHSQSGASVTFGAMMETLMRPIFGPDGLNWLSTSNRHAYIPMHALWHSITPADAIADVDDDAEHGHEMPSSTSVSGSTSTSTVSMAYDAHEFVYTCIHETGNWSLLYDDLTDNKGRCTLSMPQYDPVTAYLSTVYTLSMTRAVAFAHAVRMDTNDGFGKSWMIADRVAVAKLNEWLRAVFHVDETQCIPLGAPFSMEFASSQGLVGTRESKWGVRAVGHPRNARFLTREAQALPHGISLDHAVCIDKSYFQLFSRLTAVAPTLPAWTTIGIPSIPGTEIEDDMNTVGSTTTAACELDRRMHMYTILRLAVGGWIDRSDESRRKSWMMWPLLASHTDFNMFPMLTTEPTVYAFPEYNSIYS